MRGLDCYRHTRMECPILSANTRPLDVVQRLFCARPYLLDSLKGGAESTALRPRWTLRTIRALMTLGVVTGAVRTRQIFGSILSRAPDRVRGRRRSRWTLALPAVRSRLVRLPLSL